jgi:hypothetical protein
VRRLTPPRRYCPVPLEQSPSRLVILIWAPGVYPLFPPVRYPTSRTMQFRQTCCGWMASATRSAALGGMPCRAEVNGTGSTGLDSIVSPVSTSRHAGFCIPIRKSVSLRHDLRQEPYAVAPHVRICAGGGQQWPSLPRPVQKHESEGEVLGQSEGRFQCKVCLVFGRQQPAIAQSCSLG